MNSPTEVTIVLHDPLGRDEAWWVAQLNRYEDRGPTLLESWEVEVITVEVQ